MTRLRHVCALLVAIAMAMALVVHPASGLASDHGSRSGPVGSFALLGDDDDFDDDDDFEEEFDDDDDDVQPAPAPAPVFDDDDDDDVQPAPAPAPVSDDDDNDVQPVFDDDDDVQPAPVFDDDEPFGGGAVDEPRTDQVIVRLNPGVDPN
ncbi:MAG: hypothetical protein M3451_01720, partial [Chloroflexota bacterium]|nr:hypothetical protein [Chloroflexota bacterium]